MKKWVCMLLMLVLMLPTCVVSANAEKAVFVNGEQMELPAVEIDGEWMIPLRPVAQALEYEVSWFAWDRKARYVMVENEERKTEIQVDEPVILDYNENYTKKAKIILSKKPVVIGETMYVSSECLQVAFAVLVRLDDAVRIATAYDSVTRYENGFAIAERDGKYGYIGADGRVTIPCVFDSVEPFKGDYAIVRKDGKYGVLDKTGEAVLPFVYAEPSAEFLIYIKAKNLGYQLGKDGKPIFSFAYDSIKVFNNRLYVFTYKGKCGVLNEKMEFVWRAEFDEISYCMYDDFLLVVNNGKRGLLNYKTGKMVLSVRYDNISSLASSLLIKENGKEGRADLNGNITIPPIYDSISVSRWKSSEYLHVEKDGKWGIITYDNELVIPCVYEKMKGFSWKYVAVKKDGKWGMIDDTNQIVLPFMYEDMHSFIGGFIAVKKDGKWGFVNRYNETVIPFLYDKVEDFKYNSTVWVQIGEEKFMIDTNGNRVE